MIVEVETLFTEDVKDKITEIIGGYFDLYRPLADCVTDEIVRFLELHISRLQKGSPA